MHSRIKHHETSDMLNFIDESLRCPVCYVRFANAPRALAHLNEARRRGNRPLSCREVLLSGAVAPLPPDQQAKVRELACCARSSARKAGHTTPLARVHAKRPRCGTIVPLEVVPDDRFFDWTEVRPQKKLRAKTKPDTVLAGLLAVELRS